MRPARKSVTMRPVGVGAWSPGPTGAVGFTITTRRPSAAAASARRSDSSFDRL